MNLRDDMTNRELLDLMIENNLTKPTDKLSVNQIFNLTLKICKRLNIELNVEQKFFLMNDADIVQCEATAGAGKTTMTLLKLLIGIAIKGYSPRTMCVITYTNAAVFDIQTKIKDMMYHVNAVISEHGFKVDELPNIRSLNSLSYNVVKQYQNIFGLYNPTVITTEEQNRYLKLVLKNMNSSGSKIKITDNLIRDLLSLYDYLNERMVTVSDISSESKVTNIGLPIPVINEILHNYRLDTKLKDKVHHSDCTKMIVDLYLEQSKNNTTPEGKKFVDFVDSLYEYVIIDEYQDVSESMYLLSVILSKGRKVIVMGDGDQSIYGFRGARANNCERFAKEFPESSMCLMTYNRRCRANIIKYASMPLDYVSERIPKSIKGIKDGGEVNIVEYSDKVAVLTNLAKELSSRHINDLSDICIGYRKNFSCYYITNIFTEYGIPYRVKEEYMVGSDQLSILIDSVLDLLKNCKSIKRTSETLYKVCGINKVQHFENGKDVTEDFLDELFDEEDIEYFYELPPEKLKLRAKKDEVEQELTVLMQLCKDLRKGKPIGDIVTKLMPLLRKNFWDYYSEAIGFPVDLEKLVLSKYDTELGYIEFRNDRTKKEDLIKKLSSRGKGVQLSTFHSLKGLEFKEVHLVELASDTFPSIIVTEDMSDAEITREIDTELRLFYVACTRAKDRLTTYWDLNNLSPFYEINDAYREKLISEKVSDDDIMNLNLDLDLTLDDGLELTLFDDVDTDNINLPDDSGIELDLDLDDVNEVISDDGPSLFEMLNSKTDDSGGDGIELTLDLNFDDEVSLDESESHSDIDNTIDIDIEQGSISEDKALGVADIIAKAKKNAEESLKQSVGNLGIYRDDLADDIAPSSSDLFSKEYEDVEKGDVLNNILDIICRGVDV